MSVDDNSDEQRVYDPDEQRVYDVWISILKQCEERQRILSRDKLHYEEELNKIKELELLTPISSLTKYQTFLSDALSRIERENNEINELKGLLSIFDDNLMEAYFVYSQVRHLLSMVEIMEEFSIHNRDSFKDLLIALLRMDNKRLYRFRRTA
jgi:hypothetical protein